MKLIPTYFQFAAAGVAVILILFGFHFHYQKLSGIVTSGQLVLPARNPFDSVVVQARAALVYDLNSGRELYVKNPNEQLPIASVTKVMSALVASELLPSSTIVSLNYRQYRLKDLTSLTLVSSLNQGAVALENATKDGLGLDLVAEMNNRAAELGLSRTHFINSTGLDLNEKEAGSYSSAYDIARLFSYILARYPDLLSATKEKQIEASTILGVRHIFENTNKVVGELPGLLGSKTGFTDLAAGSLVVTFDRGLNQPLIVVVLGSSEKGRFDDVKTLVETAMRYYLSDQSNKK